jgi:NADH-quinone oxidoreductase subunit N
MMLSSIPPSLLAVIVLVVGALIILALAAPLTQRPALVSGLTFLTAISAALVAFTDPGTRIATLGLAGVAAIVGLMVPTLELELPVQRPEAGALVLLGASGAVALATSADLLQLALGLEVLSLSAVVLIGMSAGRRPVEAAFKYFVLATVSLSALLFGVGLIYLATGNIGFPSLASAPSPLVIAGVALIGVGIAFELALVPLHWGALDAYTAASPGIAGFIMAASKLAAALALGRLALSSGVALDAVLALIGVFSIIWGTVGAVSQRDLRRMLAYSAIVHAGFIALAAGSGVEGRVAAAFYGLIYGAMALLTFAALSGRGSGPVPLSTLTAEGLGTTRSLALSLGLLSLAGVPPLPGFWAKLAVLGPAWTNAGALPTVIAVAGGVAGALYYLRPVPNLLASLRLPDVAPPSPRSAIALAGLAVTVLGLIPGFAWALAILATSAR